MEDITDYSSSMSTETLTTVFVIANKQQIAQTGTVAKCCNFLVSAIIKMKDYDNYYKQNTVNDVKNTTF